MPTRHATLIVPPLFAAQLTGVYRIEIGARIVKAYRYDDTVSHRVPRAALPSDFTTFDFTAMTAALREHSERVGV